MRSNISWRRHGLFYSVKIHCDHKPFHGPRNHKLSHSGGYSPSPLFTPQLSPSLFQSPTWLQASLPRYTASSSKTHPDTRGAPGPWDAQAFPPTHTHTHSCWHPRMGTQQSRQQGFLNRPFGEAFRGRASPPSFNVTVCLYFKKLF